MYVISEFVDDILTNIERMKICLTLLEINVTQI